MGISFFVVRKLESHLLKYKKKDLLNGYALEDRLYKSYKELPKYKFNIIKISLESWDPTHSIFQQLIDVFSKLIFTIAIAIIGYSVSTSSSLLTYLNSNKAELQKNNREAWIDHIDNIFKRFAEGYHIYEVILFIAVVFCAVAISHIVTEGIKKTLHKRHLTVIYAIEKESAQK